MKVGIIQLDMVWEKKEENFKKVATFIEKAGNVDLIVLPEMFNTGFTMNTNLAEQRGGITEQFLSKIASSLKLKILAGYSLNNNGKIYNIASLFNEDGSIYCTYAKIHLFSPLKENIFYQSGEKPVIFQINQIPCSVFICYDLRFPELFRKIAKDVNVIFLIANWPSARDDHWLCLLRARAIENQCYIVGVNRVGKDENGIIYTGHSAVFDPWGNQIFLANEKDGLYIVNIEINKVIETRKNFPFLEDKKF